MTDGPALMKYKPNGFDDRTRAIGAVVYGVSLVSAIVVLLIYGNQDSDATKVAVGAIGIVLKDVATFFGRRPQ